MLSAFMDTQLARSYESPEISLAAVNGLEQVVFSGDPAEIAKLESTLAENQVITRRLDVERAFHSQKMDSIKSEFLNELKQLKFRKPSRRFISNVTGDWATDEVAQPEYWWRQMRSPVQFQAAVERLLAEGEWAWLEVGPGPVLSKLIRNELRVRKLEQSYVSSLAGPEGKDQEQEHIVRALCGLWVKGVNVDWAQYYGDERRHRVVLPTYPFQRQHYLAVATEDQNEDQNNELPLPRQTNPETIATLAHEKNKETEMPAAVMTQSSRIDILTHKLCEAWGNLLGVTVEKINPAATFFELGVDSLLLIQISKLIKDEFRIKLPFRRLLEEFTTIHSLAVYLDENLAAELFRPQQPVVAAASVAISPAAVSPAATRTNVIPLQPLAPVAFQSTNGSSASIVDAVVAQQLQIMSQQLEMLRTVHSGHPVQQVAEAPANPPVIASVAATPKPAPAPSVAAKPATATIAAFVPYQPIRPHGGEALSERQQEHLQRLVARYNDRTKKSKQHNGKYRPVFADNRAMQGFRLQWKELIYPIVSQRSQGSHIFDLDENEYVDLTMGFGVHLFGHSPSFVVDAIQEQLHAGMQLGPQSHLAGQVAESISEMTGLPRVTFCNSGTEAVMAAMRLARLATGRDKVVIFSGSYHGTFDGNLARLEKSAAGDHKTVPVGPGTTQNMVNDIIVLPYNEQESLETIKAYGDRLAAVLVEPLQSRRPDIQPRDFLHELRRLTEQSGTALIFDDIVTGFRVHSGGTQAWFGVRADIATYGKVVAGGMPIGIVAGTDDYMGGIDGGVWNYGDGSYPQSDQVVFAGTFCKHPLTMAACNAVLTHLRQKGPGLQEDLNRKATSFVEAVNRLLEANLVPMRMANFGSLMRFLLLGNPSHMDLFFYHLLAKGVFVWEGRTAYISTAHSEQDLTIALRAFEETIIELRDGGFLPQIVEEEKKSAVAVAAPVSALPEATKEKQAAVRIVPASEQQKQIWALAQMGEESSCAYNQSTVLILQGQLDVAALRRAWANVIARHESLRTVFSDDGRNQRIFDDYEVPLRFMDLVNDPLAITKKTEALTNEACAPFDLIHGPLLRGLLIALPGEQHVLAISSHHSILDGWSGGTVMKDLNDYYLAESRGEKLERPKPMQFDNYVQWQSTQDDLAALEESREFWLKSFADQVPLLELPTDRSRPKLYSFAGAEKRLSLGAELANKTKALCSRHGCTLFSTLLSAYTLLLSRVSRREELVVGIHSAGHMLVDGSDLVGHCINLVPLRSHANPEISFLEHIGANKKQMLDAYAHQLYPYSKLAKDLKLRRDPSRLTLVEAVFNLDSSAQGFKIFGLDAAADTVPTGYSKWDLSFDVCDTGNDIQVRCEYNRDLFNGETIDQWLRQYESILAVAVERPSANLLSLNQQVDLSVRKAREKSMNSLKAANLEKLRNTRRATALTAGVI